jgi:hypothetical protein
MGIYKGTGKTGPWSVFQKKEHPYLAIWGGILCIPVLGLVITGMLLIPLGVLKLVGVTDGPLALLVFIVVLALEIAVATYFLRKWVK